MRPVAPRLPDCEEMTAGECSEQYKTITVAVRPNAFVPGQYDMITRWQPSAEERTRILAGEDIYISVASPDPTSMPGVYVTLAGREEVRHEC